MAQINLAKTNRLDLVTPAVDKIAIAIDENGLLVSINENGDIAETGGGGGGGISITEITHANLYTLWDNNTLTPGAMYKITDFRTKYQQPVSLEIQEGNLETLILTAASSSSFFNQVQSIEYPQDIIYYDFLDMSCEDGTWDTITQKYTGGTTRKGKITFRKDSIKNLSCYYDWRNVKFRRWKLDADLWGENVQYYPDQNFTDKINSTVLSIANQNDGNGKILAGTSGGQLLSFFANNKEIDRTFYAGNYFGGGSIDTIVVDAGQKIYVGGDFTSFNGITTNRIIRLNSDGTYDPTFNTGTGFNDAVKCIAIDENQELIVGGYFTTYNGTTANYIIRLNTDGTIDTSFDSGTGFDSNVDSLAVIGSSVIAGGNFSVYNGDTAVNIALINYTTGAIDPSFNSGTGFNGAVYSVFWDSANSRLYVGGNFSTYNGNSYGNIVKLNLDGSVDGTFNNGGSGFDSFVYCVYINSSNTDELLVSGIFSSYNGSSVPYGFVKLNKSDGTIDTTFNPSSGFNSNVNVITNYSNGEILVGGQFSSFNGFSSYYMTSIIQGESHSKGDVFKSTNNNALFRCIKNVISNDDPATDNENWVSIPNFGFESYTYDTNNFQIANINVDRLTINNTIPGVDYQDYYTFSIVGDLTNSSGQFSTGGGYENFEIGYTNPNSIWNYTSENNYNNLSNNVFIMESGKNIAYECNNNKFENDSFFNTFLISEKFQNNGFGSFSYMNLILGIQFYENSIKNFFYGNIIMSSFNSNTIDSYFDSNMISPDFNSNNIDYLFENNAIRNGFNYNTIDGNFYDNTIGNYFSYNRIGSNFYENIIDDNFSYNTTLFEFYSNIIKTNQFFENTIDTYFGDNLIYSAFYNNSIGIFFESNRFLNQNAQFWENNIGQYFNGNEINYDFYKNSIGTQFNSNNIGGDFYGNTIEIGFIGNDTYGEFRHNIIGSGFNGNEILNGFNYNRISYKFASNIIGTNFKDNNIGVNCSGITCNSNFQNNDISNNIDFSNDPIDFLTAYHVYQTYETNIFKNSSGTIRLRYIDGTDNRIITDANA